MVLEIPQGGRKSEHVASPCRRPAALALSASPSEAGSLSLRDKKHSGELRFWRYGVTFVAAVLPAELDIH